MEESRLAFGVHDPTVIEKDGQFYVYSTDTNQPKTSGVPIRQSSNLVDWVFKKQALPKVPEEAEKWSQAVGLWAPEIVEFEGEYRMYYSASTFGSTTSYIGLATAKSPLGPFEDRGMVVKTSSELAEHNAIDANLVEDKDKNQWLVYGSFFGGIYILPIDKNTGKPKDGDRYGKRIAVRPKSVDTAIEGAFVYYNPETDYYYLFVSFDSLHDTYNIRVARSKRVDGPYIDSHGIAMDDLNHAPDEIGVKLLGSYHFANEIPVFAPGHNSIFKRSDGQLFMVHHARCEPFSDKFFLNIRKMYWLANGWPVVSPNVFEGDCDQKSLSLEGIWDLVRFDAKSDLKKSQQQIIDSSSYRSIGDNVFNWSGIDCLTWLELRDGKPQQCFAGHSSDGYAIIGRKLDKEDKTCNKHDYD